MDQRRARWDTHDDLLGYCRHSATPVGEMVLGVLGYRDPWRTAMSDATCIGLQLVNFWQDIARDLRDRDRVYLPREDMERVRRDRGRPARAPRRAGRCGGWSSTRWNAPAGTSWRASRCTGSCRAASRSTCACSAPGAWRCATRSPRQGYDTLSRRPAPGRLGRARIAAAAARRALAGREAAG